jgi:organic radical activating enzyme
MRDYAVKEIFATIQGEGHNAGTPAIFIRFAGCNLWSGRAETRSADAEHNEAECPLWCDTDFVGGERLTAAELANEVVRVGETAGLIPGVPLLVFTGGEPLLQLDAPLLETVRTALAPTDAAEARFAVETNGRTKLPEEVRRLLQWVCVSPKGDPGQLVLREGDELKVVYPAYDPAAFEQARGSLAFDHWYLQAQASVSSSEGAPLPVGTTRLDPELMRQVAAYCVGHPQWKLSVQLHKVVDIP